MTANEVWIVAIIQRPAMRERTSSSASPADSRSKRSASSAPRPIDLPSRMPETLSDSWISEEMSAITPCLVAVICLRWLPTRRAISTKNGRQREREHRQPPVEQEHRHDGRDHRGDVRDDRGRGRRHDGLHAADVVGDARLDLARAGAREEREREPLQVAVDLRPQVVHHALADDVGEPGLEDAEHAGGDRDRDHPGDERDQQPVVVLRDRDVEHVAQQERRDDAEAGRDDDQAHDRRQPAAVGAEQARHPAPRHAWRRGGGGWGVSRQAEAWPRLMRPASQAPARAPARAPRRCPSPGGTSSPRARRPGRRRGRRGCARAGSPRSGPPRGRPAPSA